MGTTEQNGNGALCEARGVTHQFTQPNGNPLVVLQDITLTIQAREVVALLGPSGCGKSTLLRILAGLMQPTSGSVRFHGATFTGINPGMALVFQSFALYPWMTVADNVRTVLVAAGRAPGEIDQRVAHAIQRVGLSGFSAAYPRELSGGMKQRVGVARAMALDPELLFLDEPFCHVDALTAETMRAEILDLWLVPGGNPSSILLVSHDIPEVVQMADRIVLLAANPGRVRQVIGNLLPRPRNLRSPEALAMIDQLHDLITGHELPEKNQAPVPSAAAEPTALPPVRTSKVLGLLERLDSRGGHEDLIEIATRTAHTVSALIEVVKAAELLGFVSTSKGQVVLNAAGQALIRADHAQRTVLWREALLRLPLIRTLVDLVRAQGQAGLDLNAVLETLAMALPHADYQQSFATVINWSRFAELLTYDKRRHRIGLATPSPLAHRPTIPLSDLAKMVSPSRTLLVSGTSTKVDLITELCALTTKHAAIGDAKSFTQAVLDQERRAATAIGHGLALPHAKLASIREFVIAIAIVPAGCDFAAADGQPVRIVALIAAPARDRQRYLTVLSAIASRLTQPDVRERMLAAKDPQEVVRAFLGSVFK